MVAHPKSFFGGPYQKTGLTQDDLSPTTIPLYEFTWDHVIPEGTIKLAITLGEHPQVATIVTKFVTVNCPSTFNRVIGRTAIKSLKSSDFSLLPNN